MYYKWGLCTNHGHNHGCLRIYILNTNKKKNMNNREEGFHLHGYHYVSLNDKKRKRIWTMRRFLFIYLWLLSYVFEWQREKIIQTIKRRVAQRRIYSWAAFPISRSLSISRVFFPLFYCCFSFSFIFIVVVIACVFRSLGQLNRWHCQSLRQWVSESDFWFQRYYDYNDYNEYNVYNDHNACNDYNHYNNYNHFNHYNH